MTKADLKSVPDVDIDEGVFKYVYIRYILCLVLYLLLLSHPRVYCDSETDEDERDEKDIVRGYQFAEYHADVYDKTESEVTSVGLDCECLGGGRIEHRPGEKYIKVTPHVSQADALH